MVIKNEIFINYEWWKGGMASLRTGPPGYEPLTTHDPEVRARSQEPDMAALYRKSCRENPNITTVQALGMFHRIYWEEKKNYD